MNKNKILTPTILVILGATGDLSKRKLFPSLFNLFIKNLLPEKIKIVGFSRSKLSKKEFQNSIKEILPKNVHIKDKKKFLDALDYVPGLFESFNDYQSLSSKIAEIEKSWKMCANKIFYLAVPPQYIEKIARNIYKSGLSKPCSEKTGFARIVVEKPFGKDFKTAKKLDKLLDRLFREKQLFRIDHYLSKTTVRNILALRFSNILFQKNWNKNFIQKIEIKLLEEQGVEGRGSFYDGVGALRDVGQNHMLQILALITMPPPKDFSSESIFLAKEGVLKALKPISSKSSAIKNTFRAQYYGYRKIEGVSKNSKTETYFKIKAFLSHKNWQGVPIILEAGKKMPKTDKSVSITFKHPEKCFCTDNKHTFQNKIVFNLDEEKVDFSLFFQQETSEVFSKKVCEIPFHNKSYHEEPYEKLLLDILEGNKFLFPSNKEIEYMWKFVDSILCCWNKGIPKLHFYKPNRKDILNISSKFIN